MTLSGQTIEISINNYKSGKIYWKGQNSCDTSTGSKICVPFGNWNYWYPNDQKKLETFVIAGKYKYSPLVKYINMWLENREQILKGGNGIYYDNDSYGCPGANDSLVYEIKDSIKNGVYSCYRTYKDHKSFLVESGQYANSERTGVFIYKDTIQLIVKETLYDNENEICNYKYLHTNFLTREEGKIINGKKEGLWKYYTSKGQLSRECNFKNGEIFESKDFLTEEDHKNRKKSNSSR